jgi:LysM repeat protein
MSTSFPVSEPAHGGFPMPALARRRAVMAVAPLAPLAAAMLLWLLSLPAVDLDSVGEYGLLTELPPAWYVALGTLVLGAATAACGRRSSGWTAAAYVCAVVIVLYATVPLVADAPTFAWTYKHIGVTRLIGLEGGVDPTVDIYNRWPGFFALAAVFSQLAGLSNPVAYAGWSEPVFALLNALLVAAIARAVAPGVRVAALAALLFTLADWVGGQYFSPQALAFSLALAVMLLVLRTLSATGAARRSMTVVERLTRRPQGQRLLAQPLRLSRRTGVALVLLLDAVIVATHQLTPYLLVLQVGALVAFGAVRPRWLVAAMLALAVAYLLPHLEYLQRDYRVFSSFNPLSNATGPTEAWDLDPIPGKQLQGHATMVLTLAVWALSLIAVVRLALLGLARSALPLLAVAFAPLAVLVVEDYGNEATLRVILFSTPWCAVLIAWAIGTVERPATRLAAAVLTPAALAALFVVAFFGAHQLYVVPDGEVRASEHFYANAPAGSVLMTASVGFPANVGPRYELMRRGELLGDERFRHRPLGSHDVPAVIESVREVAPKGFVAFSTSQARYVATYQLTPPGELAHLEAAIAVSRRFRLWHVTGDARLYELVSTARRPARPTEVRPPVYRIQPGDTLSEIAARQLGDWSRWREIARLNHVDPNMLIPGETIRLPSRSAP